MKLVTTKPRHASRWLAPVMLLLSLAPIATASGETIDPEMVIRKQGYTSKSAEKNMTSFRYSDFTTAERIAANARDIAVMPKDPKIASICDSMREPVKAGLRQQTTVAWDVTVADHGYRHPIMACHFKFQYRDIVSSQLVFMKSASDGNLYSVIMTVAPDR